jgi:glycerol-3-phosphate acyltransferase PlsY
VAALFAPFYQLLIWGGGPAALPIIADEPAAGVAPRRQHPQAAGGHRIAHRPEGGAGAAPHAAKAAAWHGHGHGHHSHHRKGHK